MDLTAGDIMIKDPVTASPDELMASAKVRMMRQGIGGLPVIEEGTVVGIITHRDTILAGRGAMKLSIRAMMTRDVLAVNKDTSFGEIAGIMKKTGYQRIPVVDKKKLVGLITQSCMISAMVK